MTAPRDAARDGALSQSIGLTFKLLQLGVVLLAVIWSASGVRQIEADARALVLRFGRVDRESGPGLLFAWPEPIERVEVAPGAAQLLTQRVTGLAASTEPVPFSARPRGGRDLRRDGGHVLTGDEGVVHVAGDVVYRVTDARAWVVARDLLAPALDRLFCSSVIANCARRALDGVLVARPDLVDRGDSSPERRDTDARDRDRLRADLATTMNLDLRDLVRRGAALGVEVERVDIQVELPVATADAFQGVASSRQSAEREVADARTAAERVLQAAQTERAGVIATATADAADRVSEARVRTSGVLALASTRDPEERALLLERLWSERVESVLRRARSVTAIDADGAKLLLPGAR